MHRFRSEPGAAPDRLVSCGSRRLAPNCCFLPPVGPGTAETAPLGSLARSRPSLHQQDATSSILAGWPTATDMLGAYRNIAALA
jgi:hypothetical protein